ncbi:MAG: hypothetical protein ACK4UU_01040 [Fimbriimonadales bacterium]
MRALWSFGLVIGLASAPAMAQVRALWHDFYNASGYETRLADWALDAQGNLYVLASLRQPEGNDALALLRYTLYGARQSVELFGQNDPYQEVGFALHLRPDNTLYIVAQVREPVLTGVDQETLIYLYPNLTTPYYVSEGVPVGTHILANVAGHDALLWISNPPAFGRIAGGVSSYTPLSFLDRALSLSVNPLNLLVSVSGWRGGETGRTATYALGAATGLPAAAATLSGQFGFVAEAFPVSENNIIVLWGAGNEAQMRMYGPDGIEAHALSLTTAYGADNTLYAYIWASEEDGSADLIRLDPATQTRMWTYSFPRFHLRAWAVDADGRVHLLGFDPEGFALWRLEPDGTPHRLSCAPPRQEMSWFHDSFLCLPIARGRWLIGSSAYRIDPIYEQIEPFHSVVGLYAMRGDTDGDGCVNDADLQTVLFGFGSGDPEADVNGDGVVDDSDLLEVLFHFGLGC